MADARRAVPWLLALAIIAGQILAPVVVATPQVLEQAPPASGQMGPSPQTPRKVEAPLRLSPQSAGVELVGQIGGSDQAVAVQGNYAYLGAGPRVLVLDVSNPAQPVAVGQTPAIPGGQAVVGLAVSGIYAYVAAREAGLRIFDISVPTSPIEIGVHGSRAERVAVVGTLAYVTDGTKLDGTAGNLRILDVTNPTAPTEVGVRHTTGVTYGVRVASGRAYVAAGLAGLLIFDVSNPTSPTPLSALDTAGASVDIALSGNFAYVADAGESLGNPRNGGFRIVDISNPGNPVLVGELAALLGAESYSVTVAGGYAYIGAGGYMRIVNVADPAHPATVTTYAFAPQSRAVAHGIALVGSRVYVTDDQQGLHIVNVATPSAPTRLSLYRTMARPTNVAVANTTAYVRDSIAGVVYAVNALNPAQPSFVGTYQPSSSPDDVAAAGGALFVPTDSGVDVVNAADPASLARVAIISTALFPRVAVVGTYAYVATLGKLRVFNVANLSAPAEVGTLTYSGNGAANAIAVVGAYAYIAEVGKVLRILNVSDPLHPTPAGLFSTAAQAPNDSPTGISVDGNRAYIQLSLGKVLIVDVANPANPQLLGTIDPTSVVVVAEQQFTYTGTGVVAQGQYAYVTTGVGLRIFDVANAASPALVASYPGAGTAFEPFDFPYGVFYSPVLAGGLIYVAGDLLGLFILRFDPNAATPTSTPVGGGPTVSPATTTTPTRTATITPTPSATGQATLNGTVALEGLTAGTSAYQMLLAVRLLVPGTETDVPGSPFAATTSSTGAFSVTSLPVGTFDIDVKNAQRVSRRAFGVTLTTGGISNRAFGALLAGDVNNSNFVNLSDYNLMRATFLLSDGDQGYNPQADFNGSGFVNLSDYNLLRANFLVEGPLRAGP